MNDEILDLEGAAALLRLGVGATRELIDAGHLPALRVNQKHTAVLREDVIDFVRTKGREQAAERKRRVAPTATAGHRTRLADLSRYEAEASASDSRRRNLLRLPEVERRTGLKRSAIYAEISSGGFPAPIKIGRASRWDEAEVLAWANGLMAKS